jgi:predicted nucleotidyltransferase
VADPNLALLHAMALTLGQLRERLVFVGGCATGLLLTNPAAAAVRPTEDVDAIVEVASLAGYHALQPLLAERGFKQTMEADTPPFRWFWNRMQLDLVPVDEHVLGFANRWYRPGFAAAITTELAPGLALRHLNAPYFLATKFEAFNDRGGRDVYASHDLEDIVTVIDGRAELADELVTAEPSVRAHVVQQIQALLAHPDMQNALPGIVTQPIRVSVVLGRLRQIAAVDPSQ